MKKRPASTRDVVELDDSDVSDDEERASPRPVLQQRKMMTELQLIKETVDEIVSVNNSLRVPVGLHKVLKETFQCKLCHAITPSSQPQRYTRLQ